MKTFNGLRLLQAGFVFVTFFIIYLPILVVVLLSFHGSLINFESFTFTTRWYAGILSSRALMQSIGVTFRIAIIATLASTAAGTLFAIGIHGLKKKQRIRMMMLNNVPVVNPEIVTGIMLYLVFVMTRRLLGFPNLGFTTMLIAHIFFSIPFVVLSVLPKLKRLDPNLLDAALDLGATKTKAILLVIVPSIRIGILTGALIAFTMSIDDFIISYFVSGSVQNVSIYAHSMLPRKVFPHEIFAYNSVIVIVTVIIMVVANLTSKKIEKRSESS